MFWRLWSFFVFVCLLFGSGCMYYNLISHAESLHFSEMYVYYKIVFYCNFTIQDIFNPILKLTHLVLLATIVDLW